MKLFLLAVTLTALLFVSGTEDPGLTAARSARDMGDVKALQTDSTLRNFSVSASQQ